MYNTILVINSGLSQSGRESLSSSKVDSCFILECDFNTKTYEDIQTSIYEIYTEKELLGNEMELQHIVFFNDKVEHTDYFSSILKIDKKHIHYDISNNDPSFNTWTPFFSFIQYCKSTFLLDTLDIVDVNHLIYPECWDIIYNEVNKRINLNENDHTMAVNFLSNNFLNENNVHLTTNWIKSTYQSDNSVFKNIYDRILLSDEASAIMSDTTNFNLSDFVSVKTSIMEYDMFTVNEIRIMLIPLIDQNNDKYFADLLDNIKNVNYTYYIFVNEDETDASLMNKYTNIFTRITSQDRELKD